MILPLSLFIISGIAIIVLILHKRRELSKGYGIGVLGTISDFDDHVTGTAEKLKTHAALVNKSNAFKVMNEGFVFFMRVLLAIVEWVRNHIHALYEKARHEKPKINTSGSSSVYLKQISEVKETTKSEE
jgi:hypothetical protein